jgi:cobalt-zinc-cadmium resistance protein CzcA
VHSRKQLRTLLDWEIVPRLRGIPGVIEVNTMGGDLKQFQVVVRPDRLAAYNLTIRELTETLQASSATVSGGYLDRGAESFTLRAVGMFAGVEDIENVVVKSSEGQPVLVKHVASVVDGAALRQGVITLNGEDEAVTGIIMMLLGSNSRDVIYAVKDRVAEIQATLPPGVVIDTIYDRADFVERTLSTVMTNLVEGALVVFIVLVIMLGSIRGALVCVVGIPASMAIALFGMHWAGVTGDLMSLGAIDFGFLVDGPIVVLEALLATYIGKHLTPGGARALVHQHHPEGDPPGRLRGGDHHARLRAVARPRGRRGPDVPADGDDHGLRPARRADLLAVLLAGAAGRVRAAAQEGRRPLAAPDRPALRAHGPGRAALALALILAAAAALLISGYIFKNKGANFVPRIDEGDAVVTIRRAPSINLEEAKRLDMIVQKTLLQFPEVITTLGMTGRAEVAIDPVGKDNNDTVVRLKPKKDWTTAHDLDGLSVAFKTALEREVPSTFFSISQPIEDRTNEMISGSRADVQIMLTGTDLLELKRLSEAIRDAVRGIDGTGDVRVERVLGMPEITVRPDRASLARYGVHMHDALLAIEAARVGMPVGWVYEGQRRFETRLLVPPRAPVPEALGDLLVETADGHRVPLSEVAKITESEGPAQIRRENRVRIVRVEVNLRGRDLLSWVTDAQLAVEANVLLPTGYAIQWSGQFENFERASKRLAVVVPIALVLIFGMLLWSFGDFRYAVSVFAVVPFALTGGMVGLILRDMEFSIPAAVGFIALAGVAVLNGVVLATDVRHAIDEGHPFDEALVRGSVHTMRAVLTTGAVAALGFLPMALATGAGSEVQRPLATTVVFGIGASTLMTMFLLPAILKMTLRREQKVQTFARLDDDEPAQHG